MEIQYKKGILSIDHVWFFSKNDKPFSQKKDVVFFHNISEKTKNELESRPKKKFSIIQYSALTDLTLDEDALFSKIRKNVRYEINKANKNQIPLIFKTDGITENELQECKNIYEKMYQEKGIKAVFNMSFLLKCIEKNSVALSYSIDSQKHINVFHIYLLGEDCARFYYSASLFRQNKESAALIAETNKALHWRDMLELKKKGIKTLDWGGIHDPKNPNGIDYFKFSFGCTPSSSFNTLIPLTPLGRLAVWAWRKKIERG